MALKEDFERWIRNAENTIKSYNNTIADCDDKIKRLQKVYDELAKIKDKLSSNKKQTKAIFKEKGTWRGEKYQAYCNAGEALDDAYEAYYNKVDAAHDAINTEIANLQAKKADLLPLIGGLWGNIAKWKAEIKNLGN